MYSSLYRASSLGIFASSSPLFKWPIAFGASLSHFAHVSTSVTRF